MSDLRKTPAAKSWLDKASDEAAADSARAYENKDHAAAKAKRDAENKKHDAGVGVEQPGEADDSDEDTDEGGAASDLYVPTSGEIQFIVGCAKTETGCGAIRLEIGEQYLVGGDSAFDRSINGALLSNDPDDYETDQHIELEDFAAGFPLTVDGGAIVDFYVYEVVKGRVGTLQGNVVAYWRNGVLVEVKGTSGFRATYLEGPK